MCKYCTSKKRKKKGAVGSAGVSAGLFTSRVFHVGAGAAVAKLVNAPLNDALNNFFPEEDGESSDLRKFIPYVVSGGKVAAGVYMGRSENEMISNAAEGVIAVGMLELVELALPNLSLDGLSGVYDNTEHVGEITVDFTGQKRLSGSYSNERLDDYQEVAGVLQEMDLVNEIV